MNALKILIIIELRETYSARSLRAQSGGGLSNNFEFDINGEAFATENCFGSRRQNKLKMNLAIGKLAQTASEIFGT